LWAGTTGRFAVLNTPEGLERMASRDLMTKQELEVLVNLKGVLRLSDAPLQWMMIRSKQAMKEGILDGDEATKSFLLDQTCRLRAQFGSIGDKLSGRIPLAYTHFVQILVDTYVGMAPFALYSQLGNYSIFAVGLLTLFYTGLLNLAKIFLDPLNNENFCDNSIYMDLGVLIRESNGGSIRWRNAVAKLPFFGT
jgi:predicted membrane chloride channel (bestrophin family)